jgi:glycerate 2-kinase
VLDPLGQLITARWGFVPNRRVGIVELAAASGLMLVPGDRRDPTCTTT